MDSLTTAVSESLTLSTVKNKTGLLDLPNEVLRLIPVDLDDQEGGYHLMLSLLLTCQKLHPVFEERLYRVVRFQEWNLAQSYSDSPTQRTRFDLFTRALSRRTDLAQRVRSLVFKHIPLIESIDSLSTLARHVHELTSLKHMVIWTHPEHIRDYASRHRLRDVLSTVQCETMELVTYDAIIIPECLPLTWLLNPRNHNLKELTLWYGTAADNSIGWVLRTMPNLTKLKFVHGFSCKHERNSNPWVHHILTGHGQAVDYVVNLQNSYKRLTELEILSRSIPDCLALKPDQTYLMRNAIRSSQNLKRLTMFPQAYLESQWC